MSKKHEVGVPKKKKPEVLHITSSQHSRMVSCRTCGYSTTDYGSHSYSTGS